MQQPDIARARGMMKGAANGPLHSHPWIVPSAGPAVLSSKCLRCIHPAEDLRGGKRYMLDMEFFEICISEDHLF